MQIQNVAIIGAGALGIMYGDALAKAIGLAGVTYVADAQRVARYADGFRVNGTAFKPKCAVSDEAHPAADLAIFAVKATALERAIRDAACVIDAHTVIISLLNGVTSEQKLERAFYPENVLYCVAQGMDATRTERALTYSHIGQLRIGIPADRPEKQPALDAAIAFLDSAGIPYVVEDDIMHRLWSKLMLNVGVNQVCMTREGGYGIVQAQGEARDEMVAAMREVIVAASFKGIQLTEADLTGYVALIDTLDPAGMPSMRQDGLAHRPSEVDLFAGTICRLAEEYGFESPVNRKLLNKVREMEANY